MYQSILQFVEKSIPIIEKIYGEMIEGRKSFSAVSQSVMDEVQALGCGLIQNLLEETDKEIRESVFRKHKFYIEHRNKPKELLDIMGTIRFERTGYKDRRTGEYVYLLDRILGIESHQRITLAAAAQVLEESILSSYAKGGRAASEKDSISKQAVKELVHGTEVYLPEKPSPKKKVKHLHIAADEDHVAAQFWKEKGDLQKDGNGNKINTLMPKLICMFEEVVDDGETSGKHRYRLVGKHYFCGMYKGETENYRFWEEVQSYIEAHYDTEELEDIYIAGDGAAWIRTGVTVLEKSHFVLDKFHIMKRINASVSHLMDSAEDVKSELWECINEADKEGLKETYRKIRAATEEGSPKYEEVREAETYLLRQWDGIEIRVRDAGGSWKCCAEGQVSHLLSDRMSSRPMGWSELGCSQMAKFRAFHWNGGKIIDLLEYQKAKKAKEERIQEQEELLKELRKRKSLSHIQSCRASIPGLERSSMYWLRALIDGAIGVG